MKKTLLLLAAVAMTASAFAQGTITFSNFAVNITRKPVAGPEVDAGTDGVSLIVGLFLDGQTTPLATTDFVAGTGLINPPATDVVVPGHAVNSTDAVFVVKGYEAGKTFETSSWQGVSASFTAGALGGPNGANPPTTSPELTNLQGFSIVQTVPEPTTIALGAIGVGALLLRRRK